MAAPKVELGWDNTDLQAGAAKAQGILSGFTSRARSTLGKAGMTPKFEPVFMRVLGALAGSFLSLGLCL